MQIRRSTRFPGEGFSDPLGKLEVGYSILGNDRVTVLTPAQAADFNPFVFSMLLGFPEVTGNCKVTGLLAQLLFRVNHSSLACVA